MNFPTIGRRVYYWPTEEDMDCVHQRYHVAEPHWDAGVIFVHDEGRANGIATVNVLVTSPEGEQEVYEQVELCQNRTDATPGRCYWMPYQQQASK